MRVAKMNIDGTIRPLVMSNAVMEWMEDNGVMADKLSEGSVKTVMKLLYQCLRAGHTYAVKIKHYPEYGDLEPLEYDDFLAITGPEDYLPAVEALTECMTGTRNAEAELKKKAEEDGPLTE